MRHLALPPTRAHGRKALLVGTVLALAAFVGAHGANGEARRSSCPNGFTAYAVPRTEADLLQIPRIAAGLAASPAPYTVEGALAAAEAIDANGDGLFCLKAVSNLRGESTRQWAYFYNARDDDTAAG